MQSKIHYIIYYIYTIFTFEMKKKLNNLFIYRELNIYYVFTSALKICNESLRSYLLFFVKLNFSTLQIYFDSDMHLCIPLISFMCCINTQIHIDIYFFYLYKKKTPINYNIYTHGKGKKALLVFYIGGNYLTWIKIIIYYRIV